VIRRVLRLSALPLASALLLPWTATADATSSPSRGCRTSSIEKGARLERSIEIDGTARKYILHVPETVDPGTAVPLLLDFHGWGHSAAGVWNVSGFKELAERDGFITAYPDGLPVRLMRGEARPGWEIAAIEANRDLAFTTALLAEIETNYCIDRAQVYSTGFSNGAFFTHILGCVLAERFAAIAAVGGGQITVPCQPGRRVPVLIYHGRTDELIPPEKAREARDQWAAINNCTGRREGACESYDGCADGAEVRYCEVDIGHRWPPEATEEIWKFFRRHHLPSPAAGVAGD
jgi:polyhydroxybutyrate depolymerase